MNEQPTTSPTEDDVEGHSIRGERAEYEDIAGHRLGRPFPDPHLAADIVEDADVEGHCLPRSYSDPRLIGKIVEDEDDVEGHHGHRPGNNG